MQTRSFQPIFLYLWFSRTGILILPTPLGSGYLCFGQARQSELTLSPFPNIVRWLYCIGFSPNSAPRKMVQEHYILYEAKLAACGKHSSSDKLSSSCQAWGLTLLQYNAILPYIKKTERGDTEKRLYDVEVGYIMMLRILMCIFSDVGRYGYYKNLSLFASLSLWWKLHICIHKVRTINCQIATAIQVYWLIETHISEPGCRQTLFCLFISWRTARDEVATGCIQHVW